MHVFAGSSLLRRMRLMYFVIVFKFTRVRVDRRKRGENDAKTVTCGRGSF